MLAWVNLLATAVTTSEPSAPINDNVPFLMQTWNLFGLINVPYYFILALGIIIVLVVVALILYGYIKERQRQAALARKRAKKTQNARKSQ
ncbi:MAG: hypothetical protein FWC59_00025 [Actinomycetia bacterium]|nr:hypothetical protein [Actinomycetes bacterium]